MPFREGPMRHGIRLELTWLALLCASSCGPTGEQATDDGPAGCPSLTAYGRACESCGTDCDCEPGLRCEQGVCASQVKSGAGESCACDADCGEGLGCTGMVCTDGAVVPPGPIPELLTWSSKVPDFSARSSPISVSNFCNTFQALQAVVP